MSHEYVTLETLNDISSENILEAKEYAKLIDIEDDTNAVYQWCFKLLKLGGLQAEVPRLVVFGQQSMGKTTLLDYIMGGPIGFSSTDTGTKQPIVIMLKPLPESSSEDCMLCTLRGETLPIENLQESMKQIMTSSTTVSSEELQLEIMIPNGVHAIFVDLPGIKDDSKEGAELTRNVVRTYVRNNPNDLYILVKKASDDPANWPWSLREFILSGPPKGLGLTPRQTVVVGTRAKDFLYGEKNELKTEKELLDRVNKRAVTDSQGNALPLFLLELFSLSIEAKEEFSFKKKRSVMHEQIQLAQQECFELLSAHFHNDSGTTNTNLYNVFDTEYFRHELNKKFQTLLEDQLRNLEKRLFSKLETIKQHTNSKSTQLSYQNPREIHQSIGLCVRELTQIVTELLTGNYMIISLPENGNTFLNLFGGTLSDNLKEGHALAIELFGDSDKYSSAFLAHIQSCTEAALKKTEFQQQSVRAISFPLDPLILQRINDAPQPDISGCCQPGQYVRFTIPKDNSQMLGHIQKLTFKQDMITPEGTCVGFYFIPGEQLAEQTQLKQIELRRLNVLLPLSLVVSRSSIPPKRYRCWKRTVRSDDWIGIIPVSITDVVFEKHMSVLSATQNDGFNQLLATTGTVKYAFLDEKDSIIQNEKNDSDLTCSFEQIFCDVSDLSLGTNNVFENSTWKNLTPIQKIAGDFSEQKLLNQLSLTHLARWLKFHLCSIEPQKQFSDHVILQLMRSVKHVIDKADWEPLVADLVQANVKGDLLHLVRLATCATAIALRRVTRAALHELQRLAKSGGIPDTLTLLTQNSFFMDKIDNILNEFCKSRAIACAEAMKELIFEQTYAIHFEMVEDFFDGCQQFEQEFLNGFMMVDVAKRVKENLRARKHKLGVTDVYARSSAGISHDMIYEEVRIQFWVAKMLLATPLTTKLYMYFIKDIKDKSKHLASDAKSGSLSETELERVLYSQLFNKKNDNDEMVKLSDDQIIERFSFGTNFKRLEEELASLKRTREYLELTLKSVKILRNQIKNKGKVDFLTKLNL